MSLFIKEKQFKTTQMTKMKDRKYKDDIFMEQLELSHSARRSGVGTNTLKTVWQDF